MARDRAKESKTMRVKILIPIAAVLVVACADGGTDGTPELVVLTPEVANYDDPSVSPDGSQIVYTRREGADNDAVWVADADGGNARQLSPSATNVSEPSWSPDGTTILYQAFDNNSQSAVLSTVSAEGGEPVQLVAAGIFMYGFRYSPDGTQIHFVSDYEGLLALRTVASGGGVPRVVVPRRVTRPHWLPDGRTIVMTDYSGDSSFVAIVDVETAEVRRLTTEGTEWFEALSPDGSEIAFESARSGQFDIWTVPSAGGSPRQLTVDVRDDENPAYSPDGRWVAYQSERGGQDDIWVVPASGGSSIRVTNDPAEEFGVNWDPDGRGLHFGSSDQVNHLFVVPTSGGKPLQITSGQEDSHDPALSPDGKTVAFEGERGGMTGVYTVSVEGGTERPVAIGSPNFEPAWSPDGSELAFESWRDGRPAIWAVPARGGTERRLSPEGIEGREPIWHPDGERVLFVTHSAGGEGKIMILSKEGGEATLFVDLERVSDLDWSPDSSQVTFSRQNVAEGRGEVYVMPTDGGAPTYLTLGQDAFGSHWSTDGKSISYSAVDADEGEDVFTMAADGSNRTRITTHPARDVYGVYLAGDREIMFATTRNGSFNMALVDLESGELEFPFEFDLELTGVDISQDRSTLVLEAVPRGNKLVAVDVSELMAVE